MVARSMEEITDQRENMQSQKGPLLERCWRWSFTLADSIPCARRVTACPALRFRWRSAGVCRLRERLPRGRVPHPMRRYRTEAGRKLCACKDRRPSGDSRENCIRFAARSDRLRTRAGRYRTARSSICTSIVRRASGRPKPESGRSIGHCETESASMTTAFPVPPWSR